MNSGSSGIVTDDTVTTGTSGMGRAGVEAASCLQPSQLVTSTLARKMAVNRHVRSLLDMVVFSVRMAVSRMMDPVLTLRGE
jgi:hypothetical protein